MRTSFEFATVQRLLPNGGTVLIIGSGPSLTQADVTLARRHCDLTIAINDSYVFATDADVLYAGDDYWWKWHQGCVAQHTHNGKTYPAFTGRFKFNVPSLMGRSRPCPDVAVLKRGPLLGLARDPDTLARGANGCHQSINLAVHLGATRIVLLGIDMQPGKVFRDGAWRESDHFAWMGRHPNDRKPPYEVAVSYMATLVDPLKALGIEVVNCSPDSAVRCFPMRALRDVFPEAVAV